jgi:hypothetical protein
VAFPTDRLPKRYYIDESGRRYLVGLSIEETFEFETLGDTPPLDDSGWRVPWQDGIPYNSQRKAVARIVSKASAGVAGVGGRSCRPGQNLDIAV